MRKKMLFLFNLKAGTSGIRSTAAEIINIFTAGGYDVLAHPGQGINDIENTIKERGTEFDVIVVSGGDGTLNCAINGIMTLDNPPPMGYIPTGTMNDFASSHHLSSNMIQAAKDIVDGKVVYTDIGRFNGRYFSYVAAFGAFTDVSYNTPQSTKNLLGKSAYILEGIKRVPSIASQYLQIECDELKTEGEYIYGMGSNALTVGGFKLNANSSVSMNDGYFEVVLVKSGMTGLFNAPVMLSALVSGINEKNKFIDYAQTKKMTIRSLAPVDWTLDGEFGGSTKEAVIECVPNRLQLIVPKHIVVHPQRVNIFGGEIK